MSTRARAGIEPDIAFTGTNDAVPWVVWYEVGKGGHFGVTNERVFAAKALQGDTVVPRGQSTVAFSGRHSATTRPPGRSSTRLERTMPARASPPRQPRTSAR